MRLDCSELWQCKNTQLSFGSKVVVSLDLLSKNRTSAAAPAAAAAAGDAESDAAADARAHDVSCSMRAATVIQENTQHLQLLQNHT